LTGFFGSQLRQESFMRFWRFTKSRNASSYKTYGLTKAAAPFTGAAALFVPDIWK